MYFDVVDDKLKHSRTDLQGQYYFYSYRYNYTYWCNTRYANTLQSVDTLLSSVAISYKRKVSTPDVRYTLKFELLTSEINVICPQMMLN